MATRKTRTEQENGSSTFLDKITGKVGKVAAVIGAVVVLMTSMENIVGQIEKIVSKAAALFRVAGTECFTAELEVQPRSVPIVKWNSVNFHLSGWNKCPETLRVHVAYKAPSGTLRIEPPFKGPDQPVCAGYDNPDCWELITLDSGKKLDRNLILPTLTRLGPLTSPAAVVINWIVYNTESKKQVRAGRAEITVSEGE